MSKELKGYEAFIQRLKEEWQTAAPGETVNQLVERTRAYIAAAGELTQDELALIAEAVREDLQEFREAPGGYRDSAFYHALQESIWSWLLELTDRTQIELLTVQQGWRNQGRYQAGEKMGLGLLVCDACGHKRQVMHPEHIPACSKCGTERFHRQPLQS